MDYEKKIREYMNSSKLYKDILSILFPELAESKDEQKSWSEEDDSILSDIVNHFDGFPLKHQTHEIFGWLVSLKQRCK